MERVELYNRLGNRDLQLKDLQTMESLANQLGDETRLANTLMLYANYFYLTGKYPETIDYARRAFSFPGSSEMEPELVFLARITWFLAHLRLGHVEQAMQLALSSLQLARASTERRQLSRVLTAVGLVAFEQKEPATAETYLVEALDIANELQDPNLASRALSNLAMFEAGVRGDYERANSYYVKSLEIAREIGDHNMEIFSWANLGFAAGMMGNLLQAKEYLEQGLLTARESGNSYSEIYILINLSSNASLREQAADAVNYALSAIELSQRTGEQSGEAWGWLYLGHAQLRLDNLDQARPSFQRALQIRERLDQPALSMEPRAGLVETALRAGDIQAASLEAEKILLHLDHGGNLNGTDEPLRVYYNCYQLLQQKQDPRAVGILQAAFDMLEDQLAKFKDEHLRQMYVENVPWRWAIQLAARHSLQAD
jgi:tetratricopeptide (TPR) repeat protein